MLSLNCKNVQFCKAFPFLSAFIIPLGVMVNHGDLQFAERIMVAHRSEMSAEWKVRFAICITSVAIQAFTKLLFSFSDVLKATNCIFQEVDNIFCLAVGIAVYDEFFSCICAAEFLSALDVFARHTSSRITFLTLTIVICRQIEGRCQLSPRYLSNFWVS